MSAVDELDYPIQDYIVLAGQRSPGLAVVRGAGSPRTWDIQQGYGLSGARVYFTGAGLAKFAVEFTLWEPEHFLAWDTFSRATLGLPAKARRSKSLSIEHPVLNAFPLSISQVVIEDVGQFEQAPDANLWVVAVKMIAYRDPGPLLVRTTEGPPGDPVKVAAPADPEQEIIAAKNAEIQRLAAEAGQ